MITARDILRFEAKLAPAPNGCLEWQGGSIPVRSKQGGRYGMFTWNGKQGYAHRFAYELWKGPLKKGQTVDHRCKNTICSHAFHLEAVTQAVNSQRGLLQSHPVVVAGTGALCKRGHSLGVKNAYHDSQGRVRCRRCARERKRTGRPRGRPRKEPALVS